MDVQTGTWLDAVDYSIDFPGEPLVQVGFAQRSPFRRVLESEKLAEYTAFYGSLQQGYGRGRLHELITTLVDTEAMLLKDGPEAVAKVWQEMLGPPKSDAELCTPISIRKFEQGGYHSYGRSEGHWSHQGVLPNMIGLTPVSAALYLAAIGLSSRPVPLSFARVLLDPHFHFPSNLAELAKLRGPADTLLHTLWIDGEHRLIIHEKPVRVDYNGRATTDGKLEPVHVLSDGWRRRCLPVFLGCPTENTVHAKRDQLPWMFDHDGTRLVRLHRQQDSFSTEEDQSESGAMPIVELAEIVPDLVSLFNDIRANPAKMLDAGERERFWAEKRLGVSAVAHRIVETALREFTPWPYPFKPRTEAELRLRPRESTDAAVALFDRLLDAPGPMRPTDLTAYFISLITNRRAEFAAWPEEFAGVWGFKIKTGDHNWINGRIWHEPGSADNPSDPVEFEAEDVKIESGRYRDRYKHRVHLRTGSLRCYIERDDT